MTGIEKFLGTNWKSLAGAAVILGAAIGQATGKLDPVSAGMVTHFGEGLLGVGLAHKLERLIAVVKEK